MVAEPASGGPVHLGLCVVAKQDGQHAGTEGELLGEGSNNVVPGRIRRRVRTTMIIE
jgi:hypothetical protein